MTSSETAGPGVVFLVVMGLLTSIGALATDIMLPALGVMGRDLGVVSTLISLPLSWLVSGYFENTIAPLVGGFAVAGTVSLLLITAAGRRRDG